MFVPGWQIGYAVACRAAKEGSTPSPGSANDFLKRKKKEKTSAYLFDSIAPMKVSNRASIDQ